MTRLLVYRPAAVLYLGRYQQSRQYMDGDETNISGIAYAVGFNDAQYFATCFREKYQLTPTEYLKSNVKTI